MTPHNAPTESTRPGARIVGLSGNFARPSRTRSLVSAVLDSAAARGLGSTQVFDLVDRIWVFRQGRIICNRLTCETNPQEIVGLITGAIDPASLKSEEALAC